MSFILDTINNSINTRMKFMHRECLIFKFHSILYDMAVLKTTKLPAKNDLIDVYGTLS